MLTNSKPSVTILETGVILTCELYKRLNSKPIASFFRNTEQGRTTPKTRVILTLIIWFYQLGR